MTILLQLLQMNKNQRVLFHNETKRGVDTADQMCGNYIYISRICSKINGFHFTYTK